MHRVVVNIIDMRSMTARSNKKWLIQMKDLYNGFVWADALADRSSLSAANFVDSVFEVSGEPEAIETNYSMEFVGVAFKKMLAKYPSMDHVSITAQTKLVVKKANEMLKNKINELILQNRALKNWTDALPVAVSEVNDLIKSEMIENGLNDTENEARNGSQNDQETYCPSDVVACVMSEGDNITTNEKVDKLWNSCPVLLYAKNSQDPVAIAVCRPEIDKVHEIYTGTNLLCYEILKVLRKIPNKHNPSEKELRTGSFVLWNKNEVSDNIRKLVEDLKKKSE